MRQITAIVWVGIVIVISGLLLENREPVIFKVIQDVEFKLPLSLAMLGSMGLGAFLVLISTVWAEIRQFRINRQALDEQAKKIRDLEHTIAQSSSQSSI